MKNKKKTIPSQPRAAMLRARRFSSAIRRILKQDGIGVIPTDTIYGISGSALSHKAIDRIYKLRKRDLKKPMIILIHSFEDMGALGVKLRPVIKALLNQYWPGKTSVVLHCPARKFFYLHRGTNSLAFRMPDRADLRALLKEVGPLVSTSANFEGLSPASTVAQAEQYFKNQVDFYVDAGPLVSLPSTLIGIKRGKITVLREGAVKIAS